MLGSKDFNVGDDVVYPAHGVGKIIAQEIQIIGGTEIKVFVISFTKDKMTLRIPVARASTTGLRHLCNSNDLQKVLQVLQGKAKVTKGMWSKRATEYENKINSGNMILIAEVVRDLHKNIDDPDRSYSERIIYDAAFERIATEFAAVENLSQVSAIEKLKEILKEKCAA